MWVQGTDPGRITTVRERCDGDEMTRLFDSRIKSYMAYTGVQSSTVERKKEESWFSRFIVPRSRPENLHLVTQTSCLLYIWQLCPKVLGTDEICCAWHCTCIYFKTVLATESLE